MAKTAEQLVLQVNAATEQFDQAMREAARNVETFEQAAEVQLDRLEKAFSGVNLSGAVDSLRTVKGSFKGEFDQINRYAEEAAKSLTGQGVDLGPLVAQARERATQLEAQARVTQVLASAEAQRFGSVERLSVAEQAGLAAGRAAVAQAQQRAQVASEEAVRLERLQAELGQTAVAQGRLVQTSSATRAGLQQVGFQVQDFAVQVAGGTSVVRAFSVQAPQMIGALQQLANGVEGGAGAFSRFAGFLGGPWGVAIGVAIPLIGMLAERMIGVGDAADQAKGGVDRLAASVNRLAGAQGRVAVEDLGNAEVRLRQLRGFLANPAGDPNSPKGGNRAGDLARALRRKELEEQIRETEAVIAGTKGRIDAQKRLDALGASNRTSPIGGGSVSRAAPSSAVTRLKTETQTTARELDGLFDQFLAKYAPAQKALNDFSAEMEKIDRLAAAGRITPEQAQGAKLQEDLADVGKGSIAPEWKDQLAAMQADLKAFADKGRVQADEFKRGWQDAARGTLNALSQLSYGLENGNFLDVMSGILDVLLQLGSIGAFGGKIATNINSGSIRARASGGPVSGGAPYLVGERGPELFVPNGSGSIIPNSALRGPSISSRQMAEVRQQRMDVRVMIDPSEDFNVRVRQEAAAVAAPMATQGGVAGAGLAENRMQRRARNRIPS